MSHFLEKPAHINGPSGLWGTFNTSQANLTSSPDGYLLTAAPADIARLDDFSPAAERAFWDFTFAHAHAGVNDKAQRGHNPLVLADAPAQCTVMCALNDGPAAWQAVGSVHAHVIWFNEAASPDDIQSRITADRASIAGHDYHPLGSEEVDLTTSDYSDRIRGARQSLRARFADAAQPEDISFSLYTKKASAEAPQTMIVEAWSPGHHGLASLSGFVRSWTNPLYPNPVSPHPMGYQYAGFKPAR